ncbi:MAG: flagellar basal body-associated FliL family protein [Paracoccaceae bacterium]
MSDADVKNDGEDPPKKGKKGLLIGVIGALVLGGGGFYATYSGMILGAKTDSGHESASEDSGGHGASSDDHGGGESMASSSDVAFIALEPLIITLGKYATSRHLRFRAHLEVYPAATADVEHLAPRILDVLNTYLRAISETELEDPASMNLLRAQMLRRVQVVVGEGKVKDLLITEFVLN